VIHQEKSNTENCQVCGNKLDYFSEGRELTCYHCGSNEYANISCENGHFICDECHGADAFEIIRRRILSTELKDPIHIAEGLMNLKKEIPMLGCENAWIAAGALMAALKNEGTIEVQDKQIEETLIRTRKQAIGGYCGLTGVCGIAPAIGAGFSVLLGAACPKDYETATTMRVVGRIVNVIADETGPCCCKSFVRSSLKEAVELVKEHLNVELPLNEQKIICEHVDRHPHGCREGKCKYYCQ